MSSTRLMTIEQFSSPHGHFGRISRIFRRFSETFLTIFHDLATIFPNFSKVFHNFSPGFPQLFKSFGQTFETFSAGFPQVFENFCQTFQQVFPSFSETFRQLFQNFFPGFPGILSGICLGRSGFPGPPRIFFPRFPRPPRIKFLVTRAAAGDHPESQPRSQPGCPQVKAEPRPTSSRTTSPDSRSGRRLWLVVVRTCPLCRVASLVRWLQVPLIAGVDLGVFIKRENMIGSPGCGSVRYRVTIDLLPA